MGGKGEHSKTWCWRHNGGRFCNCRNKLFSVRSILRFSAAPFVLRCVILSSLAALLALIWQYEKSDNAFLHTLVTHSIAIDAYQAIFQRKRSF